MDTYFLEREPNSGKEVSRMTDDKLREKLVEYIEDAHAMEQSVSRSLDSMISTTDDPEISDMLRHHK
jgi:ferritin-like metal-binding protein YciE